MGTVQDASGATMPTTTSASTSTSTEFFPDISQFEHEYEDQHGQPAVAISDDILRQLGMFQSKLEAIESSSYGKRKTGTSSLHSFPSSFIFGLANECFGYNGWCSKVLEGEILHTDFDDENGKYSASFTALVRATLGDGTYVDERGYGDAKNLPNKYMCYNTAIKQAVTEAKKNAIISLRDVLIEYEMATLDAQLRSEKC